MSAWRVIKEEIFNIFDFLWLRPFLPEDQGGKGRFTIQLTQGERVEFVMPSSPVKMWLSGNSFPDPRVEEKGYPPLLAWLLLWPAILTSLEFIYLLQPLLLGGAYRTWDMPWYWWLCGVVCALVVFVSVYLLYEWNRRHEYWVQTTKSAYLVCIRALSGRTTRPESPVTMIRESRISSLFAEGTNIIAQFIGGVILRRYDIGSIIIGSAAYGPFQDWLVGMPHVTAFQEILHLIVGRSGGVIDDITAMTTKAKSLEVQAIIDTAGSPVNLTGGTSKLQDAERSAIALKNHLQRKYPPGELLNLADANALLGPNGTARSEYWNLETGEPLEG